MAGDRNHSGTLRRSSGRRGMRTTGDLGAILAGGRRTRQNSAQMVAGGPAGEDWGGERGLNSLKYQG